MITDAATAFGRAIAEKLANDGFALVLNRPDGIHEPFHLDAKVTNNALTTPTLVEQLRDEIDGEFGRLDVVVHNQNRIEPVTIESCDDETFSRVLDENVRTAFWCTQVLGGYMGQAGAGQIVYISSIHDEKPTASSFLYSASKGAIKMLCREAALDLGRRGLCVNVIEMGPIAGDDERFASDLSDVYRDYQHKVPSTILGTPEDLANMVSFLASDASRFMNGAEIRMDGGFMLHYMDHKMKRV